MPILTLRQLVV